MSMISRLLGRERRATNIPNQGGVASSDPKIAELFGFLDMSSAAGVAVTETSALGVPAIWAAVNFLSGTVAGLPLHLYRRKGDDRERVGGPLARILQRRANPETTSFDWRKYSLERVLLGGRSFTYIERGANGQVVNLWPLPPECVTVERTGLVTRYRYKEGGRRVVYDAAEIIDIPFMLGPDRLATRGPIQTNRDTIGLAIAATEYASRYFRGGGVPPFAISGNFQSADALTRAANDLEKAVKKAASEGRQALTLPSGLEIKQIGAKPDEAQYVEGQRFLVEQIARIYSLPPAFLQDLTHGTFSNTEQQDLQFVKHTLKRWIEQIEQQLNLKLFGPDARGDRFVEFSVDGLLRGDFKTRMEGYAMAINSSQIMPNEVRRLENRPPKEGGDQLFIQGATVPITKAGEFNGQGNPGG